MGAIAQTTLVPLAVSGSIRGVALYIPKHYLIKIIVNYTSKIGKEIYQLIFIQF
jgi:hypothetical protein